MGHRFATIAAHAGRVSDQAGQPVTSPISLSTTFLQRRPGEQEEHAYSRVSNPSRDALEDIEDLREDLEQALLAS